MLEPINELGGGIAAAPGVAHSNPFGGAPRQSVGIGAPTGGALDCMADVSYRLVDSDGSTK